MKGFSLSALLILSLSSLSTAQAQSASGPYYFSFPGFCNSLQLYISANQLVFGKGTGCSESKNYLGQIDASQINLGFDHIGNARFLRLNQVEKSFELYSSDGGSLVLHRSGSWNLNLLPQSQFASQNAPSFNE